MEYITQLADQVQNSEAFKAALEKTREAAKEAQALAAQAQETLAAPLCRHIRAETGIGPPCRREGIGRSHDEAPVGEAHSHEHLHSKAAQPRSCAGTQAGTHAHTHARFSQLAFDAQASGCGP